MKQIKVFKHGQTLRCMIKKKKKENRKEEQEEAIRKNDEKRLILKLEIKMQVLFYYLNINGATNSVATFSLLQHSQNC